MPLTIPDEVLAAAHMTEMDLKRELALTLFQQERLTLGRTSALAGMSQREFQRLLADRRIPIHYGVEDFKQDLESLRQGIVAE
jgi:predicted HTH domain antitoxin